MSAKLFDRIAREGIVDTRKYRYIIRDRKVMRCPVSYLGTTAALHGWEVVKEIQPQQYMDR